MGSSEGRTELAGAFAEARLLVRAAILFSIFVNLLMLTSPIFMLQVYDRVLTSHSEETLAALVLLLTFLFLMMTLLDIARARLMTRFSARIQRRLEQRVFSAMLQGASRDPSCAQRAAPLADLEAVQRFYASAGFLALIDLPWVPVFLAATALFHPWLGMMALGGGAALVLVTLLNQRGTASGLALAAHEAHRAEQLAQRLQFDAEMVEALGMSDAAFARWQAHRSRLAIASVQAADSGALWSTVSRSFRLYLQSAILALAALLVLRGEASGGVMVAASILTGRALAPVDQLLAHWPLLLRARAGRRALELLLDASRPEAQRLPLCRPKAQLDLCQLTVTLPGSERPGLKSLNARLAPGQALAVIGASGSGKTTLARCLTGTLPVSPQMILLDGAPLAAHGKALGRYIGYLPQKVHLFDGTIAENIARLALEPDPKAVIDAARRAGLHEQILSLPQGYETQLTARAPQLSGGQIQRLGLARALYGDPVLVVLDEPDSNLDHEGVMALSKAVLQLKAEGKAVVIMAHRPAAIRDCDLILLLDGGERRAFGPADEVMRAMIRQLSTSTAGPDDPVPASAAPNSTAAASRAERPAAARLGEAAGLRPRSSEALG